MADRSDIEAQEFIQDNPVWDFRNPDHIENLRRFISENSVSLLALRRKCCNLFDILEQVCAIRTQRLVPLQGVLMLPSM